MLEHVTQTSNDFSKFLNINMKNKLEPINKSVEDMLARLEEFQTMICFAKQERVNASNLMSLISNNSGELAALFARINSVENLVEHVKSNLLSLEVSIQKAEEQLGCLDTKTSKVTNIFIPLFVSYNKFNKYSM
ncbi:hypothetical protein BDFB_011578 [Asbolus verrucosus]|uniref:Uncharacterized protein n=1 Tax=Asbolus verrucosus TaxID=1661398 RepID=A0A482VE24_ASBVE|nr:hypothetical protein BDFB_011578 [Asbolus verrucosus]